MTNKVHIDAHAGVVEIEGERDFVEGLLSKLFPLLEKAGFGSQPRQNTEVQSAQAETNGPLDNEVAEENGSSEKPKIKRKRNIAPKGHTCPDRILALKEGGFFKTKRVNGDIVKGLAEKGFTYKANQVAAATESLFTRGLIQRTKEGSSPFKYFWDRD